MKSTGIKKSSFLKDFLRNLAIILGIGLLLFIFSPDLMRQVFQIYNGLFAPGLIILFLIIIALPRKGRRK